MNNEGEHNNGWHSLPLRETKNRAGQPARKNSSAHVLCNEENEQAPQIWRRNPATGKATQENCQEQKLSGQKHDQHKHDAKIEFLLHKNK
jgi:hypothetical protein